MSGKEAGRMAGLTLMQFYQGLALPLSQLGEKIIYVVAVDDGRVGGIEESMDLPSTASSARATQS